jgi:HlyD family secretion protein
MTSRTVRVALWVAAAAAVLVALRFTVFREKPIPVAAVAVEKGRVEDTVTNSKSGTVESRKRASLSPETGGRVAALPLREGDRVRAGDPILRLADEDARSQLAYQERSLEAAQAGAAEACAAAAQAERDLVRNRALAADRIVSAAVLDQFQSRKETADAACEAAGARVRQAESAVALARVALDKTVLRAPFDGVVAELDCEIGEWIMPSPAGVPMPPVVELIDPDSIYVSAPLDEVDVARVRAGLPVRVTMDAFPDGSFQGRVVRVAPYVLDLQEQNRTFEVEVELDDDAFARALVPGASADVEVILDAREDVLRVPSYGLIEGKRVLVVRDGTARSVEVEVGLRNWERAEIRSGLAEGELVITTLDRADVTDGARVQVADSPAP